MVQKCPCGGVHRTRAKEHAKMWEPTRLESQMRTKVRDVEDMKQWDKVQTCCGSLCPGT